MGDKLGRKQEKGEDGQSELKPFGRFLLLRDGLLTPR
jgi:hypothetical protein